MTYYSSTNIPTPASTAKITHPRNILVRNSLILGTGLSGMIVGAVASLGVVMPMVHSEATQNKALTAQLTTMIPADSVNLADVCAVPSVAQPAVTGHVLGAEVTAAPIGGHGGGVVTPVVPPSGGGGAPQTFVQQLIGGQVAKNKATIENTGPSSTNQVVQTNTNTTTITNTNNISVSSTNSQQATSGSATVNSNTNAGSAVSGNATNTNTTSLNITVKNQ